MKLDGNKAMKDFPQALYTKLQCVIVCPLKVHRPTNGKRGMLLTSSSLSSKRLVSWTWLQYLVLCLL